MSDDDYLALIDEHLDRVGRALICLAVVLLVLAAVAQTYDAIWPNRSDVITIEHQP